MDNAVLAVGFIIYVTICFALISQVLTLNEDFASSWSDVSLYVMIGMRKLSASYNLIHGGLSFQHFKYFSFLTFYNLPY